MPYSAMWQFTGRNFAKVFETLFYTANELFELTK
jgi:hypothetical protein